MIEYVKFYNGFPYRLFSKRKFKFNNRLNVVIGPNGSGKTTLLHTLAAAAGCGNGGWSQTHADTLPYKFVVKRDTMPVFYQNCFTHSERSFIDESYLTEKKFLRSTGEKRIGLINQLIDCIEKRFLTYQLKSAQRPSIILDEADNHIGFAGQSILWNEIFPVLIKKYQLIIASHSIFPILLQKNTTLRSDNLISLYKNYDHTCVDVLIQAYKKYEGINSANFN